MPHAVPTIADSLRCGLVGRSTSNATCRLLGSCSPTLAVVISQVYQILRDFGIYISDC